MTAATYGLSAPYKYGRAYQEIVKVADPSAGAAATFTVGGRNSIRILTAYVLLTTSATVANRFLTLDYLDGDGGIFARIPQAGAVAASDTGNGSWILGLGTNGNPIANGKYAPLPPLVLPPGFGIQVTAFNLDTTDAITDLVLYAERYSTGQDGYPLGLDPPSEPIIGIPYA